MTKLLSEDAVAAYRRDGYYFPVDILSAAETRILRDKLEAHERATGGPIQGDRRHKTHLYLTFLNDLIRRTKCASWPSIKITLCFIVFWRKSVLWKFCE